MLSGLLPAVGVVLGLGLQGAEDVADAVGAAAAAGGAAAGWSAPSLAAAAVAV